MYSVIRTFCTRTRAKNLSKNRSWSAEGTADKKPDGGTPVESSSSADVTFEQNVAERGAQSRRSVVVQVGSIKSAGDVHQTLSKFGKVSEMFHYKCGNNDFILVEMEERNAANDIMKSSQYTDEVSVIPARSRFLWLKSNGSPGSDSGAPSCLKRFEPVDTTQLRTKLLSCSTISEQIEVFYSTTKLTELDVRLRFLVCNQIETAFKGIFPYGRALPFGSSVNGCGRSGTDLDMVFECRNSSQKFPGGAGERLHFHAKTVIANNRPLSKYHMEVMSDILNRFLPGFSQIRRILNARVPIIKFIHDFTGLECDLSTANMTGFYMSELLHLFGEVDSRFRPLIFAVRQWAKEVQLTNESPGSYNTNFSLTLLVVYFLQTRTPPILPTLGSLIKGAKPEEIRTTEGIDCTFTRDPKRVKKSQNDSSLEDLLYEFFHFMSTFPFDEAGISIVTGKPVPKMENCAMLIQNPIERDLNVTKNVNLLNTRKLVSLATDAMRAMNHVRQRSESDWGLLALRLSSENDTRTKDHVVPSAVHIMETTVEKTEVTVDPVLKNALENMKSRAKTKTEKIKTLDRSRTVLWKY